MKIYVTVLLEESGEASAQEIQELLDQSSFNNPAHAPQIDGYFEQGEAGEFIPKCPDEIFTINA